MKNLTATICLTIAVLLGSVGVSWSADWNKGLTAFKSGDYATALREWTPLADKGNARAQNAMGSMYKQGLGVPKDDNTAVKWYRLSAENGEKRGQFSLGLMYASGKGVPLDYKTALKWWTLAAKQGHARAQWNLGVMYEDGDVGPKDYKTAVKWYTLAAKQGFANAQSNLDRVQKKIAKINKLQDLQARATQGDAAATAAEGKVILKVIGIKTVKDRDGYPQCKVSFRVTNGTGIKWKKFGLAIKYSVGGKMSDSPSWSTHYSMQPGDKKDFSHIFRDADRDLPCSRMTGFSFAPNPALDKRSVRGKRFKNNKEAHLYFAPLFAVDPTHDSTRFHPLRFNRELSDYYGDPTQP